MNPVACWSIDKAASTSILKCSWDKKKEVMPGNYKLIAERHHHALARAVDDAQPTTLVL